MRGVLLEAGLLGGEAHVAQLAPVRARDLAVAGELARVALHLALGDGGREGVVYAVSLAGTGLLDAEGV